MEKDRGRSKGYTPSQARSLVDIQKRGKGNLEFQYISASAELCTDMIACSEWKGCALIYLVNTSTFAVVNLPAGSSPQRSPFEYPA